MFYDFILLPHLPVKKSIMDNSELHLVDQRINGAGDPTQPIGAQSEGPSSSMLSQDDITSPTRGTERRDDYEVHLQESLKINVEDDDDDDDCRDSGLSQASPPPRKNKLSEAREKTLSTRDGLSDVNAAAGDIKCQLTSVGGAEIGEEERMSLDGTSAAESEDSGLSSLAEEQLKKPLPEVLSDVAKFAYSSLIAVCLPNLFENQWNKQWNLKTVKILGKYLKLPKQSMETLAIMVEDPFHHDLSNAEAFAGVLSDDPTLIKPDIIPKDMITRALHDGTYDARMRVLAFEISRRLGVRWDAVAAFEKRIIDLYQQEEHELSEEEKKERDKKAKIRKAKRYLMIGAATIGGGAIIGLTGGLAAPLIASAGAALLGTSLGFFGTVAGAAVLGSILGAAGAGLSGYKMRKRVGEVEEFEFVGLTEGKDLHVTIVVSGWLTSDRLDNFSAPWLSLASCHEIYTLKWESKYLLALGQALEYILDSLMTMAAKEALKYTVLSGLLAAIALPAVAYGALSSTIDNPWSVATSRAVEAGKQLAEVLLSRQQGKRPVTLIGFSMGARVIFSCLQELSQRKGSEGIVQDVYLLGAPVTSATQKWQPFAKVVAGKIVNGYCRGDWLLQFVYRTASMQVSDIAGLEKITWDDRRMVNIDLTEIVNGHLDYSNKMDTILDLVGLETRQGPRASSDLASLVGQQGQGAAKGAALAGDGDETPFVMIDASDLLIPKSASAVNLALTKKEEAVSHTAAGKPPGDQTEENPVQNRPPSHPIAEAGSGCSPSSGSGSSSTDIGPGQPGAPARGDAPECVPAQVERSVVQDDPRHHREMRAKGIVQEESIEVAEDALGELSELNE